MFQPWQNQNMNQELILQLAFLQGHHALIDAQAAFMIFRRRRNRRNRSCWVGPWLSAERRLQFGHYDDRLLAELRMEDQSSFFNFLRMPPEMFDELSNRVGPRIRKIDTECIWHLLVFSRKFLDTNKYSE